MQAGTIASKIDHTLLVPTATALEIKKLCYQAKKYGFRAVCVHPAFVSLCKRFLGNNHQVLIVTVNDFPFGIGGETAKITQALAAVQCGAQEIDTVINLSACHAGNFSKTRREIEKLVTIAPTKVIVESAYWSDFHLIELAKLIHDAGAFCLKTSTGFGPRISLDKKARQISLVKKTVPSLKVKAAGGIKTLADAKKMLSAGADIIGSSSGMQIIAAQKTNNKKES